MAITLTYLTTTVTLHDDMRWTNEFSWTPVQQATQYTITGALLVDTAVRQTGRPITLEGDSTSGWLTYATLQSLQSLAAVVGAEMTLNLRGLARTVVFDHASGAIVATPVGPEADPLGTDYWVASLKFIEV